LPDSIVGQKTLSHTRCSCLLLYFLTAHTIWGSFDFICGYSDRFPFSEKPALLETSVNSPLFCF